MSDHSDLVLREAKRRRTSKLWNFFTVINNESASCNVCQGTFSYRSTTTNLMRHIKSKHPWLPMPTRPSDKTKEGGDMTLVKGESDEETFPDDGENDLEWNDMMASSESSEVPRDSYDRIIDARAATIDHASYCEKRKEPEPVREPESKVGTKELPGRESKKDEFDLFGELIACKLRNLPSARTRSNVQHVISTVLWEAGYGKYDNYGPRN